MPTMTSQASGESCGLGGTRSDNDREIFGAIQDIIVAVMSETTALNAREVRADWSIDGCPLAMDSVGFVRMIIAIEKRFGIMVPDSECSVAAMPTVGSVAAMVGRHLTGTPGAA